MDTNLLDPRNDVVFKLLFADSLHLLTHLVNAMRYGAPPVTVAQVLNPAINPEEVQGKQHVLDILALDDDGNYFNVEMQISRREEWGTRGTLYAAKVLASQLKIGSVYARLKPVICIHLLCYDLFGEQDQALWRFELRDRCRPHVRFCDELEINVVELPKADRLARKGALASHPGLDTSALSALEAWINLFLHWQEESIMSQIDYEPALEAREKLKVLSADEEARRLADAREIAQFMERVVIAAAEERGEERAEKRWRERTKEAMEQSVQRLIAHGMTEEVARAMLAPMEPKTNS